MAQIRKGFRPKSSLHSAEARRRAAAAEPDSPRRVDPEAVRIEVVQGIGDILWAYQKLAPHFEKIHFDIMVFNRDTTSKRSGPWLSLLPKVVSHRFHLVNLEHYLQVTASKRTIDEVLADRAAGVSPIPYAVNKFLEEGTRIDEIDRHPALEDVGISHEPWEDRGDFLALYVSGDARRRTSKTWPLDRWIEFIRRFYARYKLGSMPIRLLGAGYDMASIRELRTRLPRAHNGARLNIISHVDDPPARVCGLLKASRFFIGYNSGLGIFADNLDVPQLMLYFSQLKEMHYAWCKRAHAGTVFQACSFDETPDQVLDRTDMRPYFG